MLLQKRDEAIITDPPVLPPIIIAGTKKPPKNQGDSYYQGRIPRYCKPDLRNPLNNISLATQNLLEDPKDIKELAASISRERWRDAPVK